MARPRIRKAWNGGSSAAALAAAQRRTDAAIAAGCPRCACCGGDGGVAKRSVCPGCGGAGFLVPAGGMPAPTWSADGWPRQQPPAEDAGQADHPPHDGDRPPPPRPCRWFS
jgi:hypothetical protein